MLYKHKERNEGKTFTVVNNDIKRTKVMVTVGKSGSYIHLYDIEGGDTLVISVIVDSEERTTIQDKNGLPRLSLDSDGTITFGANTVEV